ncbi:MAG: tRNA (adenosine(37)-N6)-threonylcarbamoyltransferase complex transferase subunit TsaD [Patescibacteria group bacterium]|nr:tRNA (adenosine(37)-N6)-threonylcarbamoyltransferase complex transferase subunit TsaD [Patescibacteria group bacterium]
MYILGIETTCDETGLGLIEVKENRVKIIDNQLSSQVKIHQPYGGVVPILAAREHEKNLPFLFKRIKNSFELEKVDYLAFSVGPGLLPSLLAGKKFIQELAKNLNKKVIPVNHLSAHWYSVLIRKKTQQWQKFITINFPALVLVVSGGHTTLYVFKSWNERRKIGETVDDAAGECLDKCARALGLGYPGGPEIERRAKMAKKFFSLPKPLLQKGYQFSFAGLKTAFIDLVSQIKKYGKLDEGTVNDLCASLQKTIFEIIIYKMKKASRDFKVKTLIVSGGVSANQTFKRMFKKAMPEIPIYFPQKSLATDNGINIALAGYFNLSSAVEVDKIEVFPR